MFFVRYDENKRTHLSKHKDDGRISVNILLDDGFEGGGTQFWDRREEAPFAHVQPNQIGQILMHSALLHHEGVHLERGRRTIFVGFLEVDRVNPFAESGKDDYTGISWYSSWGNLHWVTVSKKLIVLCCPECLCPLIFTSERRIN